ncbi:hypothetical protein D3C87_1382330 [compost metagenome]
MTGFAIVELTEALILVPWAPFPDFVVMRITPFAPREPYTAAEAASFKTETLSTSFILIRLILTSGIPSTTISGLASFTVPKPRINNVALLFPAIPEV